MNVLTPFWTSSFLIFDNIYVILGVEMYLKDLNRYKVFECVEKMVILFHVVKP